MYPPLVVATEKEGPLAVASVKPKSTFPPSWAWARLAVAERNMINMRRKYGLVFIMWFRFIWLGPPRIDNETREDSRFRLINTLMSTNQAKNDEKKI
jgi:hypothetical protein